MCESFDLGLCHVIEIVSKENFQSVALARAEIPAEFDFAACAFSERSFEHIFLIEDDPSLLRWLLHSLPVISFFALFFDLAIRGLVDASDLRC